MEVAVVILSIIAAIAVVALVHELRRPAATPDHSERDQALADLTESRIREGELKEANRSQEHRIQELLQEKSAAVADVTVLNQQNADLRVKVENARTESEAKQQAFEAYREQLAEQFTGIASSVTQSTRDEFIKEFRDLTSEETTKSIERMDKTVKPLRESIEKLDKQSQEMEQVRQKAYGSVEEMIAGTGRQLNELNLTTTGLRQALSAPQQRGRWGELTLERVLEVSGMLEHVTYERQHHTPGEDGAVRPDAIIHMPRELTVPVDAKAPLTSYLEAHDAPDDSQQRAALEQHARSLMGHARQLGSKSYADAIEGQSPDFVVLFLPAETILDAAMTAQPSIWEDAWTRHRVLIATPGLLIALLRTIGVAWQQEEIQRNAQDIADAAKLLYERLGTFTKHVDGVGGALDRAVKAYNDSIGSFERRVLPQARRMEELGAIGDGQRIEEPRVLDGSTRQLNAPELNAGTD